MGGRFRREGPEPGMLKIVQWVKKDIQCSRTVTVNSEKSTANVQQGRPEATFIRLWENIIIKPNGTLNSVISSTFANKCHLKIFCKENILEFQLQYQSFQ